MDSTGFNDQGWLDAFGHPQSEELGIRERFRNRDFRHMNLELTIDDPKIYTKPFTVRSTEVLIPDSDILEYASADNDVWGTNRSFGTRPANLRTTVIGAGAASRA